jgi:hypothetical protein
VANARCLIKQPDVLRGRVPLVVRRVADETAHAEAVEVTYEVNGSGDQVQLPNPITVCRQLSEC